jgi:hypothetical protein
MFQHRNQAIIIGPHCTVTTQAGIQRAAFVIYANGMGSPGSVPSTGDQSGPGIVPST